MVYKYLFIRLIFHTPAPCWKTKKAHPLWIITRTYIYTLATDANALGSSLLPFSTTSVYLLCIAESLESGAHLGITRREFNRPSRALSSFFPAAQNRILAISQGRCTRAMIRGERRLTREVALAAAAAVAAWRTIRESIFPLSSSVLSRTFIEDAVRARVVFRDLRRDMAGSRWEEWEDNDSRLESEKVHKERRVSIRTFVLVIEEWARGDLSIYRSLGYYCVSVCWPFHFSELLWWSCLKISLCCISCGKKLCVYLRYSIL